MTMNVHYDQARKAAIDVLSKLLESDTEVEKGVLGQDLFGLLRVILWLSSSADEKAIQARINEALAASGQFWTGEIWLCSAKTSHAEKLIYSAAWDEGITVPGVDRLRIDERTRTRTAWLPRLRLPIWDACPDWRTAKSEQLEDGTPSQGPPIVVFYSFKGGVGRTTALASFAIQRARDGQRVLVVDLDLDAPGAGTLLAADPEELPGSRSDTPRGVVDYLLEAPLRANPIQDYVHHCKRVGLVGENEGEIMVMPAGRVDENYLGKLSRLDLEIRHGRHHPMRDLLIQARDEIEPDWILLDARTGLSSAAGLLLDGIAHQHVLFGTNSPQSQLGLELVIRHMGEERILRDLPQAKCVIVQAMVVDVVEVEKAARAQFQRWLEETMRNHYLLPDKDPDDEHWSVREMDEPESPSQAVAIPYSYRLAFFPAIDDVVKNLVAGPYFELGQRIVSPLSDVNEQPIKEGA